MPSTPISRIPERSRPGLAVILSLEHDRVSELANAIYASKPSSSFDGFAATVYSQLKTSWKREELNNVLRSLYSLSTRIADDETPVEELASQVLGVMRGSAKGDFAASEESGQRFLENLALLLSVESLRIASKAWGLRSDHERLFCEIKIITDIRPVFSDVHDKPPCAIVDHVLKLGYHEHGDHKEFYVSLDRDDITALKKALTRAEAKETSLRAFIAESGIRDFDRS